MNSIHTKDVQHLADLARIDVPESEAAALASEMERILDYVKDVEKVAKDVAQDTQPPLRNVFREDVVTNEPGEYTDAIVAQFPEKEGNSLKVPKIL